jgi:hypothetical protein
MRLSGFTCSKIFPGERHRRFKARLVDSYPDPKTKRATDHMARHIVRSLGLAYWLLSSSLIRMRGHVLPHGPR